MVNEKLAESNTKGVDYYTLHSKDAIPFFELWSEPEQTIVGKQSALSVLSLW